MKYLVMAAFQGFILNLLYLWSWDIFACWLTKSHKTSWLHLPDIFFIAFSFTMVSTMLNGPVAFDWSGGMCRLQRECGDSYCLGPLRVTFSDAPPHITTCVFVPTHAWWVLPDSWHVLDRLQFESARLRACRFSQGVAERPEKCCKIWKLGSILSKSGMYVTFQPLYFLSYNTEHMQYRSFRKYLCNLTVCWEPETEAKAAGPHRGRLN